MMYEEKARAYTFTDSRDLQPPAPYRYAMRGTDRPVMTLSVIHSRWKWIAAQLNVIVVTGIHTPVPRVTYPAL